MQITHACHFIFLLSILLSPMTRAGQGLQLAKSYHENIDVSQYYVSEKLDGVRGRWDGKRLLSKNGNEYFAPKWFIDKFPDVPLDGELWISRGKFEQTVSIVSRHQPGEEWKQIKFMIFDLPGNSLSFEQRVAKIQQLVLASNSPYLKYIEQSTFENKQQLQQYLNDIIAKGGEGVMLHKKAAYYQIGRTESLLKLKAFQDAEAVVIGHTKGKGKYHGMLGALIVKNDNGKVFKIGTGFTTQQRQNPPVIGSVITYKYWGYTNKGIPKFSVFMRIRKTL